MLSALLFLLPSVPSQASLPHPTLPVRSGIWSPETCKLDSSLVWMCLNPSWRHEVKKSNIPLRDYGSSYRQLLEAFPLKLQDSEGWTEAEAEAWLRAITPEAVTLEFSLRRGDEILFSGREVVAPGVPMAISDLLKGGGIFDFDVEIAQGSAIGDPVEADIWSGTSMALQLFPVAGQGWQAEVALAIGMGGSAEEMDFGNAQIGGKKRLRGRLVELGFTTLLTPGGEGKSIKLTGSQGEVELHLSTQGEMPSIIPFGKESFLLPSGKEGFGVSAPANRWESHPEQGPWVKIDGPDARARADAHAGRLAEKCITKSTTLALEIPSEEGDSQGATLTGSFLQEYPVRFAVGDYFDALTGWDVEVATGARIGDPRFNTFFSGACGEIRILHGVAHLDIGIRASGVLDEMNSVVLLAGEQPGGSFERGRTPVLPMEEVLVEHPFERILRFNGDYPMTKKENGERLELSRSARILLGSAQPVRVVLETGK